MTTLNSIKKERAAEKEANRANMFPRKEKGIEQVKSKPAGKGRVGDKKGAEQGSGTGVPKPAVKRKRKISIGKTKRNV